MKSFKYFFAFIMMCMSFGLSAQENKIKDTTVTFKVSGACEMCKHRIEEALKIKGITSADWSVDSKMLTVIYSSSSVSISKIHKRIAEAGHDTELEKANDAV